MFKKLKAKNQLELISAYPVEIPNTLTKSFPEEFQEVLKYNVTNFSKPDAPVTINVYENEITITVGDTTLATITKNPITLVVS